MDKKFATVEVSPEALVKLAEPIFDHIRRGLADCKRPVTVEYIAGDTQDMNDRTFDYVLALVRLGVADLIALTQLEREKRPTCGCGFCEGCLDAMESDEAEVNPAVIERLKGLAGE